MVKVKRSKLSKSSKRSRSKKSKKNLKCKCKCKCSKCPKCKCSKCICSRKMKGGNPFYYYNPTAPVISTVASAVRHVGSGAVGAPFMHKLL